MIPFMKALGPETHAMLRIVTGFLFLWHGTQKLFGFPVEMPPDVPAFIVYVAGPIELVGGALVMIGLLTGYAAFVCSGLMACAYWMGHGFHALFPIQNNGELAALYCFAFLYFAANGAGIWSVDAMRGAGRSETSATPA